MKQLIRWPGAADHVRDGLLRLLVLCLVVVTVTYGSIVGRVDHISLVMFILVNCVIVLGLADSIVGSLAMAMVVSALATLVPVVGGHFGALRAIALSIGLST